MTWTRRDLLKASIAGGAAMWLPSTERKARANVVLTPFVDPLPRLRTASPSSSTSAVARYRLTMAPCQQTLHRDLPLTRLWGYGDSGSASASVPGPVIEARRGQPIEIQWDNALPTTHFLPIDTTLEGATSDQPAVRTVAHVHGLKMGPESDGHPEAWFTNGYAQTGPAFRSPIGTYPNDQPAAMLWYHDHAMGITRLNVYAGLFGAYILREDAEDALQLPAGPYEVPLVVADRTLGSDGSLVYPQFDASDPEVPPIWMPEAFGESIVVNGKIAPFLEVEPRRYRLRFVNASNARFYNLTLQTTNLAGTPIAAGQAPAIRQIGTDQGLLAAPVVVDHLIMAPGERLDVVVDFAGLAGSTFTWINDAAAPYPDGDDVIAGMVLQLRVTLPLQGTDASVVPDRLASVDLIDEASATRVRDIPMSERTSSLGNPIAGVLGNAAWSDPVTEDPSAGAVEVWRFVNTTDDEHPVHLHLVRFQVIDRQPFDVAHYRASGEIVFTGPAVLALAGERPAWKDTVRASSGCVTRIVQRFDLPAGTVATPGQRLRYVYHCHLLEHEDHAMMRPFDVVT